MTDYHTGAWLRSIRLYRQFTQKEMAKRLGTNRSTYSTWESRYKEKRLPNNVILMLIKLQIEIHKNRKEKTESIFRRIIKWIMQKK